jgi:hypothetical protein
MKKTLSVALAYWMGHIASAHEIVVHKAITEDAAASDAALDWCAIYNVSHQQRSPESVHPNFSVNPHLFFRRHSVELDANRPVYRRADSGRLGWKLHSTHSG